jgi:energy-coupling factor transport system ATP-binding protein
MTILSLEHVTYAYPGSGDPVLSDVSLTAFAGELIVLCGQSGSGKTSLLRVASGLVPHFHGGEFAGRALVAGVDTRQHGPGELARSVGTLFQDPETQVVMGTPRAELAFPLENRGLGDAAVARGVEETALALGIAHLLDQPTAELSGGELQRVALGAALVGRPPLIVLDEPTSQLDPVAGDELLGLLRRINEDSDATILLSEHRLERCLPAADRVLAMAGGRIVCDAPPGEFLEWAELAAPELQTPGARLLQGVGLRPRPGVKAARAALRDASLESTDVMPPAGNKPQATHRKPPARTPAALAFEHVWHELREGRAILKALDLTVAHNERVALMGRNGAGKSTLLRHAAGLMKPTRGRIKVTGRVALLLQNPNDYLIHETIAQEASADALEAVGLQASDSHPRDLSVGEKQRLALAVVLGHPDEPPSVLCLDEPTRGMDRRRKGELASLLMRLEAAVLVATHDPEFVAQFADRVVVLADGRPIADGPPHEVLGSGIYFATETARIVPGALTPEDAVTALMGAKPIPAPDQEQVPT